MSNFKKTDNLNSVSIDEATLIQLSEEVKEEAQTIVHCSYVSKKKYINGGWVNIYPTTFLVHENESIPLIHAINIPVAPQFHVFKRAGELKQFTLVFPKIPQNWTSFSLIEKCDNHNGFVILNIAKNSSGIYEVSLH
jgi:hypothetical protein